MIDSSLWELVVHFEDIGIKGQKIRSEAPYNDNKVGGGPDESPKKEKRFKDKGKWKEGGKDDSSSDDPYIEFKLSTSKQACRTHAIGFACNKDITWLDAQ